MKLRVDPSFLEELTRLCGNMVVTYGMEPPTDLTELATSLRLVRACRQHLSDLERMLERLTAEAMPDKLATIDGLPTFEKKWSAKQVTWNDEPLAARVAAASRDERILDEATGVIEGEAEAAVRVLLGAARIDYWRVGDLKGLGIDPDEYREKSSEGRHTVRFYEDKIEGAG
jgi:hypothetical protein